MAQTIPGTLRVSNDVIADLAGYAALECYGVVGMAYTDAQDNIVRLLSLGSLRKGIDVSTCEGRVKVDLHTVLEQGVNMASVSRNLESAVRFTLKEVAEIDNADVTVPRRGPSRQQVAAPIADPARAGSLRPGAPSCLPYDLEISQT